MICTRISAPTKEMLAQVLAIPEDEDITYSPETLASFEFEKSIEESKNSLESCNDPYDVLYSSPEYIEWESDRRDAGELWLYRTPAGCLRELINGGWELCDALVETMNLFPSISKDELIYSHTDDDF
jgi:hypothetical protein